MGIVPTKIKCACGCGEELLSHNQWGRPKRWLTGHHTRGTVGPARVPHQFIDGVECKRCFACRKYRPLDVFAEGKNWDGKYFKCNPCRNSKRIPRVEKVCACGCGTTFVDKVNGKKRFLKGHSFKLDHSVRPWLDRCSKAKRVPHQIIEGVECKPCSRCKVVKPIGSFGSSRISADRLAYKCKSCEKSIRDQRKDEAREYQRQYHKNPDNRRKYLQWVRRWRKKQWDNNPEYRFIRSVRNGIWAALTKSKSYKKSKTADLLGCSFLELKSHLESQFSPGMSWDNYGRHVGCWCIDHIIPVASFDLSNVAEQKRCFHYTNLQPLWVEENSIKNDYLPDGTRGRDRKRSKLEASA